jgi:hypothetical protein
MESLPLQDETTSGEKRHAGEPGGIYLRDASGLFGRLLSQLDAEASSPSRGSFDRTWWCWKFTDFSATRFQEGVYPLAWLATSDLAPTRARDNPVLVDLALSAVRFWSGLQHADGSFDEAYPFERSLAATAFTGFYVGAGIERLASRISAADLALALRTVERGADWLARNGEYHGVLSNHLAAAAGALQVAADLLGTDRFNGARDRYVGIIYANQDAQEGWLREYGGADPGYQSHGMFYLAEIWRRTRDRTLLACLKRAAEFISWFAHPDGTLGGEYASRGTKFAYPAAFEILATESGEAAGVARHFRRCLEQGRGVGPSQMDAWNLMPMFNNFLFAAEAAGTLPGTTPDLPWMTAPCRKIFPRAGLAVAREGARLFVAGLNLGGTVKLWNTASGALLYEDCGYGLRSGRRFFSSQTAASPAMLSDDGAPDLRFRVEATFSAVPRVRFGPWRFMAFRSFTLTLGRLPAMAKAIKQLLVKVLIRGKTTHAARLVRTVTFRAGGELLIEDELSGLDAPVLALARQVPIHMGSARYADLVDWLGAQTECPPVEIVQAGRARRTLRIPL